MIEYATSNGNGPITWVDGVLTEIDLYYPVAQPPAHGDGLRLPLLRRARRLRHRDAERAPTT